MVFKFGERVNQHYHGLVVGSAFELEYAPYGLRVGGIASYTPHGISGI